MRLATVVLASCLLASSLAGPAAAGDLLGAELNDATPLPDDQKVSFYVGLDRPENKARTLLRQVSDPAHSAYREFLSRAQVAARFGAPRSTVKAARRSVEKYGLKLHVDDTGAFARVSGTVGQMNRWVGKPVYAQVLPLPGGEAGIAFTKAAEPRGRKKGIREFYGQDFKFRFGGATTASANPPFDGSQDGTPQDSCLPDASPQLNELTYSVNELRTAYGLDALPRGKKVGKATRVAIVAQGDGFSNDALSDMRRCFALPKVIFERVNVRGVTGDLPEGGEGDLDVQIVQSVLPAGSRVSVVQTSGFDGRDFLTWATVFALKRQPAVATTSYGMCEVEQRKARGKVDIALAESVLLRLGLVGTSVFAAAGDRGSSGCVNNESGQGNTKPAIQYPSSSHYVTAVGGTRIALTPRNRRADEVTWFGPALDNPQIPASKIGGAGGYSKLFDRPWWQPKAMVRSKQRAVPDISAHASPLPGWPVVTTSGDSGEQILQPIGGTSAATPFTAATFGVLAASERLKGQSSFGPLQPLLYHLAQKKPSTFYDVRTGSNDVFGVGCCAAKAGYDAASGIGAVRFDRLAERIPR